ncbi:MAG: hypothetical protein KDD35_10990 [Bdellovibrionales bacterium]|nr:hypothetical protein [Bdellovibrionales bacterium]
MKQAIVALVAIFATLTSQANVPSISTGFTFPQQEEISCEEPSNISRLQALSHYLLVRDTSVSWVDPYDIGSGLILKVRSVQPQLNKDEVGYHEVWTSYQLPFSDLNKRGDEYQLLLPVSLNLSYRDLLICGAEVEGAGFVDVYLPHGTGASDNPIKSYAVDIKDLEFSDMGDIRDIPVYSSCFE